MHGRFVTERILNALHSDSNRCPLIDQFLPNQSFCDEDAAEDDIHRDTATQHVAQSTHGKLFKTLHNNI